MRLAFQIVIVWALLFGGYLFLAGSLDPLEIGLGLVCGSLAAALGIAMSRIAKLNFAFTVAPKAIFKPLAALPADFILTGRALLRTAVAGTAGECGQFQRQPFTPGNLDPATATRRAIGLIAISFTPRSFMVRLEGDHLLLHSLPASSLSDDKEWPV